MMELLVSSDRNFNETFTIQSLTAQAPVVQRTGIFIFWIATDPLDKVIRSLNNRGQPDLSFGEFKLKQLYIFLAAYPDT